MDQDMQQYLDKAEVLIEALTYIQRFNRKIIVVKYGGSAMLDEELQKNVIKDVTFLKLVRFEHTIDFASVFAVSFVSAPTTVTSNKAVAPSPSPAIFFARYSLISCNASAKVL